MAYTKSTSRKSAAQIAGLFYAQALESIKRGDSLRIDNYNRLGWASTFLSERQYDWLMNTYEREQRGKSRGAGREVMNEAGDVIGVWEIGYMRDGRAKLLCNIGEKYREDVKQWQQ